MSLLGVHQKYLEYFDEQQQMESKLAEILDEMRTTRDKGIAERWPQSYTMLWIRLDNLIKETEQKLHVVRTKSEYFDYLFQAAKSPLVATDDECLAPSTTAAAVIAATATAATNKGSIKRQERLVAFIDQVMRSSASKSLVCSIYESETVLQALKKYQENRQNEYVASISVCQNCLTPLASMPQSKRTDHYLTCISCGYLEQHPDLTNQILSKNDMYAAAADHCTLKSNVKQSEYQYENHFNEILLRAQGSENTQISSEIINALRSYFRKQGIVPRDDQRRGVDGKEVFFYPDQLTPHQVQQSLKDCGYTNYYEHRVKIWGVLVAQQPPTLTSQQEQVLKLMFKMIQAPFEQCPAELKYNPTQQTRRANFLNYDYVLFKLCEVVRIRTLEAAYKIPKSPQILMMYDNIWKFICDCLQWPFYATQPLIRRDNFNSTQASLDMFD